MPQRFLRPGITNSERWNSITWKAQSLFIRLMTLVDDFGRHDGRPSVIWGQCFAVWNEQNQSEQITMEQTDQMLSELSKPSVGLIDRYEVGGKKCIQITQWQERVRDGAKEKWPANTNPQESAGIRSVPLPPSSPPSPSPSPAPDDRARADWDGSIPTWAEVKTESELRAIPESSAKSFFDYHENNSLWINQHGRLIHWRSKLRTWADNDRSNPKTSPRGSQTPKNTVYAVKTVIETKRKLADDLKNKHATETGLGIEWSDQSARTQFRELRREIKELELNLSKMA